MKRGKLFIVLLICLVGVSVLNAEQTLLPYYVEIESLSTDLRTRPGTDGGADYDADIGQLYTTTVFLENVNGFALDSVYVKLYGSGDTEINGVAGMDSVMILSLSPYEASEVNFDVRYTGLNPIIDSLYAHISPREFAPGDTVYGQVVDNDLLINVEDPAYINAYSLAPDSVTVPNGPPDNYVTEGQEFNLLFEWTNTGEDMIDSVKFSLHRRASGSHASAYSTLNDTLVTFYNIPGGDTISYYFNIVADDTVDSTSPIYEYFAVNLEGSWAQNTGGVVDYTPDDTLARVKIQQPPDLTLKAPDVDKTWLNKVNTVNVCIPVEHPGAPYAKADLFVEPDYPAKLTLFQDGTADVITGGGGVSSPFDYPAFLDGAEDTFCFALYNDGVVYQGMVDLSDTIYCHDANWPGQLYPVTVPFSNSHQDMFKIDTRDPNTYIYSPTQPYYNAGTFPDTVKLHVTDNLSGVASVYYQVIDSLGRYWDGTNWVASPETLYATPYGTGDNWWGELPNFSTHPDSSEDLTIYAWAKDTAGNVEATMDVYNTVVENDLPLVEIFRPDGGYWSELNWDDSIKVEAVDVRSGVKVVRVCIHNLYTDKYWDGTYGVWVSYRKFNTAYHLYGNVWGYNYTPDDDGTYLYYAAVRDSANNYAEDTLDAVLKYDTTAPWVDLTAPVYGVYN
ncbi:hypothetical protein DRH29_05400, partial [candidate division Kazan bacterium]